MNKILTAACLFLALMSFPAMAQMETSMLPRLKTSGNSLVTPEGKPVTLRGVSLCSLEWHNAPKQINTIMAGPQSWPVDVLRLPVQPREWKRYGAKKYIKEKLEPAVKLCKQHNVYCIIDWHKIGKWQEPENVAMLEEFWKIVAIRYSNDPRIMYEIFNEPTSPGKRSVENWLVWRDQMQKWVDMVRADAPDTLLLIGSPHWSQMPKFAVENPLKGDNLAYVVHVYPNWKPKQWDNLFGEASKSIPIFMSEWGWSSSEGIKDQVTYGTQEKFGVPMKQYLKDRPQISWTAWSYDKLCGPAMLGKDSEMGTFVKDWLMEERAAKAGH